MPEHRKRYVRNYWWVVAIFLALALALLILAAS
jgi:hypothetical protein